jgi:hypothetical protein
MLIELGQFLLGSFETVISFSVHHLFQHFLFLLQFNFGLLALDQDVMCEIKGMVFELQFFSQLLNYFISFINLILQLL